MRLLTAGHLDGVFLQLCLKDPTIVGVDSRQCRPALRLLPSQTTDLSDYPNHPSYVSGPLPPRIERMCAAAGLRRQFGSGHDGTVARAFIYRFSWECGDKPPLRAQP